MKWITRERPKIDRIACPWLIRRFVDLQAEFLYVPPQQVLTEARRLGAIPYDVPGVELTHDDHEMLAVGLRIYEALYAWCRDLSGERHGWQAPAIPALAL